MSCSTLGVTRGIPAMGQGPCRAQSERHRNHGKASAR